MTRKSGELAGRKIKLLGMEGIALIAIQKLAEALFKDRLQLLVGWTVGLIIICHFILMKKPANQLRLRITEKDLNCLLELELRLLLTQYDLLEWNLRQGWKSYAKRYIV